MKIRRRGRHATPSQVEKDAQQAGKAAPAVAIAGALVTAAQASPALAATVQPVTAATQDHQAAATDSNAGTGAHGVTATLDAVTTHAITTAKSARHAAAQSTYYHVRTGDTLSKIADRYYHNPGDWQYLYQENAKTIPDPDLIYTGEPVLIPATVPAHYQQTDYVPKHARSPQPPVPTAAAPAPVSAPAKHGGDIIQRGQSATNGSAAHRGTTVVSTAAQSTYNCSGLEGLWDQEGGNPASAFMAAEIAMAESGGNANAISPTDDYGLWQINASNGSLATLNPFQNAKSAITLSDDGTNWNPWTTYASGAYSGQC